MEKVVFVAYTDESVALPDEKEVVAFNERLLADLDAVRYPDVTVQVADREANERWLRSPHLIPGQAVVVLSAWTETADDVDELAAAIGTWSPRWVGLVVTESIPRWSVERRSSTEEFQPGYTVVATMRRAPHLSPEEFERHWIEVHMPMSLRIHPAWNYVRNVRARSLTPGADDIDALSDEGFERLEDITEPSRFYGADGDPSRVEENRRAIGEDVPKFLDVTRAGATIMREYRLRDFRA